MHSSVRRNVACLSGLAAVPEFRREGTTNCIAQGKRCWPVAAHCWLCVRALLSHCTTMACRSQCICQAEHMHDGETCGYGVGNASKLCLTAGLGLYTGSAVAPAPPAEAPGGTQDAAPLAPPAPSGVPSQVGAAGSPLADPPHAAAQEEAPPTTGGGSARNPLSSAAGSNAGRALCLLCVCVVVSMQV